MAGLGLVGALGVQGGQQALEELMATRKAAELLAAKMQQQQFENQRQLAGDARANRALDQTDILKRLQLAQMGQTQDQANDAKQEGTVLRSVSLRPIGGEVTPGEHARETGLGVPEALYAGHPANLESRSTTGSTGNARPICCVGPIPRSIGYPIAIVVRGKRPVLVVATIGTG